MPLSEVATGREAVVLRLAGEPLLRERLAELGFTPGVRVRVLRRAPLGDPLEVAVRGTRFAVRVDEARDVIVEPGGDA